MRILWLLIPGFFVGAAVMDGVRRIFSENSAIVPDLFRNQPATMIAAATTIGSIVLWGLMEIATLFGVG